MKKCRLIIIIMLCIVLIGCRNNNIKLKDRNDALNYLKNEYPEEDFEILSEEIITISCDRHSSASSYSWKVKSLNTNIEFELTNRYDFNTFTCVYHIKDEYFREAIKKFLVENQFENVTSHDTCYNCIGYEFKKENFNDSEEMLKAINEVINKINTTIPFKYNHLHNYIYFYFDVKYRSVCLKDIENGKYNLKKIVNDIYSNR